MSTPNYIAGVGRLVTDRYDFQNHIDGYSYRHEAGDIDLNPNLVIDGTSRKNVQEALTAALPYLAPPTLPDATLSSKGVVQLSGDISDSTGTATNVKVSGIRGYSITNSAPSNNDVLTYDSSISSWKPAATQNVFTASGDLAGNGSSQTVIGLTGTAGSVRCSADSINFVSTVIPSFSQVYNSSGNGHPLSIASQDSSVGNGGQLILRSGVGGGTNSFNGKISLYYGNDTSFEIADLAENPSDIHRKVISLLGSVSTTEMPNDTGDGVIYIKDASIDPGVGLPVGGTALYSSGGKLNIVESGGKKFTIASNSVVYCSTFGQTGTSASPYISWTGTDLDWVDNFNFMPSSINAGDIINVQFNGNVKISGVDGYLQLCVQDDYASYKVIDQIHKTSLNDHICMSGSFAVTSSYESLKVGLRLETLSAGYPIEIYKPLSILVQIIRL